MSTHDTALDQAKLSIECRPFALWAYDALVDGRVMGLDGSGFVASDSKPGTYYRITDNGQRCTCPARKLCKHLVAFEALTAYDAAVFALQQEAQETVACVEWQATTFEPTPQPKKAHLALVKG
jgi:hypothetical protein